MAYDTYISDEFNSVLVQEFFQRSKGHGKCEAGSGAQYNGLGVEGGKEPTLW